MRVVFSPGAERQLDGIFDYIAENGSPSRADAFVSRIVAFCERLDYFPLRGRSREEWHPSLRTIPFEKQVLVAYTVSATEVRIVGIFYGGQDFETALKNQDL